MRPEVTAFRELETLVRKLSDQLAGYRRRALSSESRARELEVLADDLRASVESTEVAAASALAQVDGLTTALRASEEREAMARDALAREMLAREALSREADGREQHLASGAASTELFPAASREPARNERALARENAELKTRLADASERTRHLAERIRFLRQQVTQVADK